MKFVANRINGNHLADVLPSSKDEIDGVYAAIAYGTRSSNENRDLISNCVQNKWRLDIWMRYDHTVPVAIPLLERLLANHRNNVFCRLVPDRLHAKVIWWKGYGAYVGSANLSDGAWLTNIEAGIFFSDEDLQSNDMLIELEAFFDWLKELDVTMPLTREIINEMEDIQKARAGVFDKGKDRRTVPVWSGPASSGKQNIYDRRKENFRKEWHETLTFLRNIADQLVDNKPVWVSESIPINWQVDQFLHAYYYNIVSDGNRKPFNEFHEKNCTNPGQALSDAIKWWRETDEPPSNEDKTFEESAPYIMKHLNKDLIVNLDMDTFGQICYYTHATSDHISKIRSEIFGKPKDQYLAMEDRVPLFAAWLWGKRNKKGWTVVELINHVLYGGDDSSLWERLYLAGRTDEYHIPRYGLNSLAEVVGWARPEIAPPRNGRTSKALRALGFDVKIY